MDKRGTAVLISMVFGAVCLGSMLPSWLGLVTLHHVATSTSAKLYEGQPITLTEAERGKVVELLLADLKCRSYWIKATLWTPSRHGSSHAMMVWTR